MAAEDYNRVKEIFIAVSRASTDEQLQVLAQYCAGDDKLSASVERLLDADRANAVDSRNFMESTNWTNVLRDVADGTEADVMRVVRVGAYEIVRSIGEGGMSVVYEGIQPAPRRRVAIKLISPIHISTTVEQRLAREADLLARLDHPGITRVYEAGLAEVEYSNGLKSKRRFQVMELVDGDPLTLYAEKHQLELRGRLTLMVAICDAVHHAHQRGIIHRDLKPSNILVNTAGHPKVLDFGISRLVDTSRTQTSLSYAGHVLGTLAYMSPEQASGDGNVDTRTDVYALGVLLFNLISGQFPVDVDDCTIPEAIQRIANAPARRLTTVAPHLAAR